MKRIKPLISKQNKYSFSFGIKLLLIFLICHGAAQGKSEFSELISLNTNNEPLVEVLDSVSQASGYEIIIDEIWDDMPITVKFESIPVEQALKRILANVNHAIVYNSDRRVLIRIYEKNSSVSRHTDTSTTNRRLHVPAYQPPVIETPTSPNPVPPEPISEEAESDDSESGDSELSSRQPETPDEESEEMGDDDSSDEGSEAEDSN
jgi:hypothetical protein